MASSDRKKEICGKTLPKIEVKRSLLFENSKMQQSICQINKCLELMFKNLNKFIELSECLNKVNNCDDIKVCKIVVNKVNQMKANETIDGKNKSLFACVWPQCR
jgi:DNA polymerase III delta prime subunit